MRGFRATATTNLALIEAAPRTAQSRTDDNSCTALVLQKKSLGKLTRLYACKFVKAFWILKSANPNNNYCLEIAQQKTLVYPI